MNAPSVVQATAWYPPHSTGGTEVYLEALTAELSRLGIENAVLVPQQATGGGYMHRAIQVETYPVNAGVRQGFDQFKQILARHKSAIYHQHAWTPDCGLSHLKAAREMGMRTVLTVHVPGNTCLRGTMLRFGEAPCVGRVDPATCGACWAQERGLPKFVARAVGHLPVAVARLASQMDGRWATALSSRYLGVEIVSQIEQMIAHSDRIIAVSQWLYDVLALNGVHENKLALCRQGVSIESFEDMDAIRARSSRRAGPLRLLLLARWNPIKGVDVAVRAVRALSEDLPVELRICAIPAPDGEGDYEQLVRSLAAGDARIRIEGPVPRGGLAGALAEADVLLAPSTWLETGPLVVLEAQAAGVFVLGSRRGGIAELVDENDGGKLVEAGDVAAWTAAIAELAAIQLKGELPRPLRTVRTMVSVAEEMAAIYRSLL